MASIPTLLCPPSTTISPRKPAQNRPPVASPPSSSSSAVRAVAPRSLLKPINFCSIFRSNKGKATMAALLGAGFFAIAFVGPASAAAADLPLLLGSSSLQLLNEPSNALSLPTWAIHVSSVVEWITAMALVWQYGEKSGNESWKGLSWGMVPLLGGAFCACTWHFFYNSEALQVMPNPRAIWPFNWQLSWRLGVVVGFKNGCCFATWDLKFPVGDALVVSKLTS
ncbi:uncharacterized protein LOC131326576 isoform X1 [Rhododendron vialii]|uniref:uncharacterized protein LOC131326576 isoform X1 n=1 Tax=Rhododendron vialii TaxID=182163 RepID=UPI00265FE849|nr:uncharacterized protein LOC131326576 isoform X1 [Rhododendron vialii]